MNTFVFGLLLASLCGLTSAHPVIGRRHHREFDTQDPDSSYDSSDYSEAGVHNPAIRLVGSTRKHQNNGGVVNFQDTVYAVNMSIGGEDLLIQLDTGSSDLWVQVNHGEIDFSNTTDIPAEETYGIGQVKGTIQFADVRLGDNSVDNQAFMNVSNAANFNTIFNDGVRGILGLAFDAGSTVDTTLVHAYGSETGLGTSFLVNLFEEEGTRPLFTVQLGRTDDPEYTTEGAFTIGKYLPDYAMVADMPKLHRFPNNSTEGTAPRWSVVMSGMTINDKPFQFNTSGVSGTPEGSVVAVLDTGFTFPPIPKAAVDAIYGGIQGAYFDTSSNLWIVPCNKATDVAFQFGDMSVPIHPLDLTTLVEINSTTVCVNTFRPSTFPVNDQFDMILGDAFLKNVYASFDYGDWSKKNPDAIPYIQLLPTTNIKDAKAEFKSVRAKMFAQEAASVAAASASSAYAALSNPTAAAPAAASKCPCNKAAPTKAPLFTSAWSGSGPSAAMSGASPESTASSSSGPSDPGFASSNSGGSAQHHHHADPPAAGGSANAAGPSSGPADSSAATGPSSGPMGAAGSAVPSSGPMNPSGSAVPSSGPGPMGSSGTGVSSSGPMDSSSTPVPSTGATDPSASASPSSGSTSPEGASAPSGPVNPSSPAAPSAGATDPSASASPSSSPADASGAAVSSSGPTDPSSATAPSTGATDPSASTAPSSVPADPSATAVSSTGAMDPSSTAAPSAGSTDPSSSTAPSSGATDPSATAVSPTGAVDPSSTAAPSSGATDPSSTAAPSAGAMDPSSSAAPSAGATDPSSSAVPSSGAADPSSSASPSSPASGSTDSSSSTATPNTDSSSATDTSATAAAASPSDTSAQQGSASSSVSSADAASTQSAATSLPFATGGVPDSGAVSQNAKRDANPHDSEYSRHFRRSYRAPTKTVADCLTPFVEEYGVLLFALIAGSCAVSLALCLVSVVLAVRNHARAAAQRRGAYIVLDANREAEADPEAAAAYRYSDNC